MGGSTMNPTVFAMRRPITTLMLVVALISGGVLAYSRMRVDIFPVAEHARRSTSFSITSA